MLEQFYAQMGITFPFLYDVGSEVMDTFYVMEFTIGSVYPKDWIVGVDGSIVYTNNKYDSQEMITVIESELAKIQ